MPNKPRPLMKDQIAMNKSQQLDVRGGRMQQSGMILDHLEKFALGTLTKMVEIDGEMVEVRDVMTGDQVRAAAIQLNKILPDLSQVQQVPVDSNQLKSVTELEDDLKLIADNSPDIARLLGILPPVNE